ncbi:MAG: GLUG motif-containing protein [Bacteriovoracaceae bacterium]
MVKALFIIFFLFISGCIFNPHGTDTTTNCDFLGGCYSEDGGNQSDCDLYSGETDPTRFGSGTPGDPHLIYSANQLNSISNTAAYVTESYTVMCDLDLSSIGNFNPIGDSTNNYVGTFDGNNKTISNLTISSTGTSVGFIGYASGATIQNVRLTNVSVTSTQFEVGGIVGFSTAGTISDCSVSGGTVQGYSYVGSIVGEIQSGTDVTRAWATSNVNCTGTAGGHGKCGGLIGGQSTGSSTISSVYYNGSVTDTSGGGTTTGFGGIAGRIANTTTITDGYAEGTVYGEEEVGGIVGAFSTNSVLTNVFSLVDVTCNTCSYVSEILGSYSNDADSGTIISNSYYLDEVDDATTCYTYHTTVPAVGASSDGVGNCESQTTLSDYYNSANEPMNSWSDGKWSFSGTGLPTLTE